MIKRIFYCILLLSIGAGCSSAPKCEISELSDIIERDNLQFLWRIEDLGEAPCLSFTKTFFKIPISGFYQDDFDFVTVNVIVPWEHTIKTDFFTKTVPHDTWRSLCLKENLEELTRLKNRREYKSFAETSLGLLYGKDESNYDLQWQRKMLALSHEELANISLNNCVDLLSRRELGYRRLAISMLKAHTGEDFNYNPDLLPNEQPKAISAWERYRVNFTNQTNWMVKASSSDSARTRSLAAYIMGKSDPEKYRDTILKIVQHEKDENVLRIAIYRLSTPDKKAISRLQQIKDGKNISLQIAAAFVLAKNGNIDGLNELNELLNKNFDKKEYYFEIIAALEKVCETDIFPSDAYHESLESRILIWRKWLAVELPNLIWDDTIHKFRIRPNSTK